MAPTLRSRKSVRQLTEAAPPPSHPFPPPPSQVSSSRASLDFTSWQEREDEKATSVDRYLMALLFVTSLSTFIISVLYDHYRLPILKYLSATLPSNPSGQFIESALLLPCVLLVPVTHIIGTYRYNNTKKFLSWRLNGGFTYIILQGFTWAIWTLGLIVLILFIFANVKIVGILSSVGMLGMFAQGLMVSSIMAFESDEVVGKGTGRKKNVEKCGGGSDVDNTGEEEDDHRNLPVEMWVTHVNSPEKNRGKGKRIDAKYGQFVPVDGSNGFTRTTKASRPRQKMKRYKLLDFCFWALMNYLLLQAPHILRVGVSLLNVICFECVTTTQRLTGLSGDVLNVWVLLVTLAVPLFTHGVGGRIFVGDTWSFHHPLKGGKFHILSQATGWVILFFALLLQVIFSFLLSRDEQKKNEFLIWTGATLSWVSEAFLLVSLLFYRGEEAESESESESEKVLSGGGSDSSPVQGQRIPSCRRRRRLVGWIVSFGQDIFMTNVHWFCIFVLFAPPIQSSGPIDAFLNFAKVVALFCLPSVMLPYSRKRKTWGWKNPLKPLSDLMEVCLLGDFGLFFDSKIIYEEEDKDEYTRGGCMFAMTPHGTLPVSVWACFYQFREIFEDCCLFFGSQVALIPFYRLFCGIRGGCMPITKANLLRVMGHGQNVALVPGGVHEMMKCRPFDKDINISIKHKGFIRVAIQKGYDLVPVLMLHENDFYNNPLRDFQHWCYKISGIPLGLPYYTNKYYLPMSNRKPLRVIVGRRICTSRENNKSKASENGSDQRTDPSTDQSVVDEVHEEFYKEVARCWIKHKEEMGFADRELHYVTA